MSNHRESKILKKLGLKSATENKPPVVSQEYFILTLDITKIVLLITKFIINLLTMNIIYFTIQKVFKINIDNTILVFVKSILG